MVLSYKLSDGVALHKKYPRTFEIPSDEEIKQLGKGDFAKLIFDGKERMWVRITKIKGNNFEGVLDNVPIVVEGVKFGDRIKFQKKHIVSITWR